MACYVALVLKLLSRILLFFAGALALAAQTIVITNGVAAYTSLSGATVTMSNRCELRLTAPNPLADSVIHLNSSDVSVILQNVKPSIAVNYLPQLRINGAPATLSNCRVTQYAGAGSIILPHTPSFQPLAVFAGPHFTGSSISLRQYVYYRGSTLGALDGQISSFKLKRGYMATLAQNTDGAGASRNYVAQDGDLEISVLPADLENNARFVFVTPWRWSSKKGIAGNIEGPLNVQWKYNWNISEDSTRDIEYVPIRQNRWWPDLAGQNWQTRGASHLLGFNEPDRPDQANMTVADALGAWGDLLRTGLRLGAPAVSDGGRNGWLYPFMTQADAAGARVDFVPIHYYWCFNPADPNGAANQMYNFLKATYDVVKRPLWITEWNNGANWTGCGDPTYAQQQAAISAMINMLEATPFVERYALYNWVEDVRRLEWDNGALTEAGVTYRDKVSALAYLQAFPNNGARSLAYLPFDGDHLDRSGYGNNAVASGSPAFVPGRKGDAISFDGANTILRLPENVARANSFSFAAWLYWKGGANWQRIFDFGNSATEYLFLTPSSGGSTLRFAIKDDGSEQIVETTRLPINQWTHVAITLSGSVARLYVNGALAASNTGITISPANFSPRVNFLGESQFAADPLFNGLIDDLVISDAPLSASQIAALQNGTAPIFSGELPNLPEATQGQPYSASVAGAATDTDGDTIAYSKATGPAWLAVSSTGAISGTPTGDSVGTVHITVRATDPSGLSSSSVFPVTVRSSVTGGPALLARYPFDVSANDTSGNAFHPQSFGAPPLIAGRFSNAIDLDGADAYLRLPWNLLSTANAFTFGAWVYWEGGAAWQRIFDFGNDSSQYLFLTPSSGGGRLRFAIKNGGAEQAVEAPALPTAQWNHVAVTISGNTARLYVNGALAGANSTLTITPAAIAPRANYLGKSQYPDPLFNGRLDEVLLFNYALSAAEISRLGENRLPPPTTGAELAASVSGGQLVLSWGPTYTGWRLEQASSVAGPWDFIEGTETASQTTINMDGASAFYRLVYP